ncbi:alpha,alpha-trehalose-phosphate synthase (UDP-forming) [Nitrospirillum pindoramense]|uniref:Trehalose 6-phosphate synthase n=1 Tax=Nitrospirillum amazonense TaxID=28077 RepID=A0A560GZY9_9PROT|nr:trehalose-6-phosphate synthase [Nitrospirillum amazonense]TWB39598.1 trehalose 6-phosphate synthase [Nitrospirillum amazonense]
MKRLVIVSNRVPAAGTPQAGGLVVALADLLRRHKGLWFGWSDALTEKPAAEPRLVDRQGVSCAMIDLTPEEHRKYYLGFSNSVLWPLMHILPGVVRFHPHELETYRAVNVRFAQALKGLLKRGDLIWVQDYQLLAVPAALRELRVSNPIGFFLHIPFPPPVVAAISEGLLALVRDVLSADLIGFQTATDAEHFAQTAAQYAGARRVGRMGLKLGERTVRLGVFPVEIDAREFARVTEAAMQRAPAQDLAHNLRDRALVLGVDRLDPSKGLAERLTAYQQFLAAEPDWRRRVSFLQIAAKSREGVQAYRSLLRELEKVAGATNGANADPDWTPLKLVTQSSTRTTVASYMRHARVGLVTPLRDGMNLVAKEFVAAQDPSDPGVLILSRFAGAATQLQAALQVNPYDPDQIQAALRRALTMPLEERRERWQSLWDVIKDKTALAWGEAFAEALAGRGTVGQRGTVRKKAAPRAVAKGAAKEGMVERAGSG